MREQRPYLPKWQHAFEFEQADTDILAFCDHNHELDQSNAAKYFVEKLSRP